MQASVRAVETRNVPTADAAAARPEPPDAPRRLSQRTIELVGLALGVAFIAAVALGHELSNDEFWSLAAGQWMLAHHAVMGLDPFSYTESHRRWVTDEWGSELALAALFRAFGAAAYGIYAVVLGGLCLLVSATYARALGARGGRVVAIVLLLAVGIAGVVVGDRGLDFSLVWFPLELLVLTRARADPRWLFLLPLLCVAWVNTHGSILIGLVVLGVELVWSLVPARLVERVGGVGQSPHTGALALAVLGSVVASCITPYGPGLVAYDVDVAREHPDRALHQRMELARLPLRDGRAGLLRAAGRARGVPARRAGSPCWRGRWRRPSSWRRCGRSAWCSTSCWSRWAWRRPSRPGRRGGRWRGAGPVPGWSWARSSSSPRRPCPPAPSRRRCRCGPSTT